MIHEQAQYIHDVVGCDGYSFPYVFLFMILLNNRKNHRLRLFIKLLKQIDLTFLCPECMTIILSQFQPYNHSNIDSDEVLYYVDGDFMRKYVDQGYISLQRVFPRTSPS